MSKPTARIENWFKFGDGLIGHVIDHPRQDDFEAPSQLTSKIIAAPDGFKKGATVETENTFYVLGDMAMSSH